jgi:hypothetical protein
MNADKSKGSSTARNTLSKAAFIRSLPRDMPSKEVVQKGKALGLSMAEDYVHKIRSTSKKAAATGAAKKPLPKAAAKKQATGKPARKAPGKKAAPKSAAKKATGKPAQAAGAVNKALFVRKQPRTIPAKDVVAAGAKLGIALTTDYVHKVRSTSKSMHKIAKPKIARKKGAPARKIARKVASPRRAARSGGASDHILRKLVLEVGVPHAKRVIADFEAKLSAVIAGR